MKKTKYMMSGGLAFTEASDMKKLRKKSLQGWHLKKFSMLGYRLEEGKPEDVIYTIDYRFLDEENKTEYFELFRVAGWEHVCSEYNMHIFKAPKGTKPIYTDKDTTKEKYKSLIKPIQKLTIMSAVMLFLFLIIKLRSEGITNLVSTWMTFIMLVTFAMLAMTLTGAYYLKWKRHSRSGGEE